MPINGQQTKKGNGGTPIKNNPTAGSDPTVNDDSGQGYSIGSQWDTINPPGIFIASDVTPGAAVWHKVAAQSDIDISDPTLPSFIKNKPITPLIYKALLNQNTPATVTDGLLLVGAIYTLTTYNGADDFSNMELLSGIVNTSGSVFKAIVDTPTAWGDASVLDYNGAPYVVSTDGGGNFVPFINTIGNLVWSYIGVGNYLGTLTGAFNVTKTGLLIGTIDTLLGAADYFAIASSNDNNTIIVQTYKTTTLAGKTAVNDLLYNTSITIEVYP